MRVHEVEANYEPEAIKKLSEELNIPVQDIEVIRRSVNIEINKFSNK